MPFTARSRLAARRQLHRCARLQRSVLFVPEQQWHALQRPGLHQLEMRRQLDDVYSRSRRARFVLPMKRLISLLLISCTASTFALRDVKVLDTGADADPTAPACADFALRPPEAEAFFAKATVVTARELHDGFIHAPCFVRGTATVNGRPATWQIRAAGTASVTVGDTTTMLADPSLRQ